VVELRLVNAHHHTGTVVVYRAVFYAGLGHFPFGNHTLAIGRHAGWLGAEVRRAHGGLGGKGVEQAVAFEVWVKGYAQQAALVVVKRREQTHLDDAVADVQKHRGRAARCALGHRHFVELANLVGYINMVFIPGRKGRCDGRYKPAGHRL
jgi:hypothetical protein